MCDEILAKAPPAASWNPSTQRDPMEALVSALATQRNTLERQVEELRAQAAEASRDRVQLLLQLRGMLAENLDLGAACEELRRAHDEAARLSTSVVRLHGLHDRTRVLDALTALVRELFGCTEMLVLEADRDGRGLRALHAAGVEPSPWRFVPHGRGVIGGAAASGTVWVRTAMNTMEPLAEETHVAACVPLLRGTRVVGMIALFQPARCTRPLAPIDETALATLGTHAAAALFERHVPVSAAA